MYADLESPFKWKQIYISYFPVALQSLPFHSSHWPVLGKTGAAYGYGVTVRDVSGHSRQCFCRCVVELCVRILDYKGYRTFKCLIGVVLTGNACWEL